MQLTFRICCPLLKSHVCQTLKWTNDDVDMEAWQMPDNCDVTEICTRVTYGPGWVLLKKMFSDQDVEMARERILMSKIGEHQKFSNTDDKHNNFNGLTWGLLSRGKIFAKVKCTKTFLQCYLSDRVLLFLYILSG